MNLIMNKSKEKNVYEEEMNSRISYELLILLLMRYFIGSELFLIIAFCYLMLWIIIRNDGILFINTGSKVYYLIIIMVVGIFIGLVKTGEYGVYPIVRDVFYILNPVIFIQIGVYVQKKWRVKFDVYKTIIVLSAMLSIIGVVSFFSNIELIKEASTVGALKEEMVFTDVSTVVGCVLLITERERGIKYFSKKVKIILMLIFFTYLIVSFSRTNLIVLVLMIMPFVVSNENFGGTVKRMMTGIVLLAIISSILYVAIPNAVIDNFLYKITNSSLELSTKNDWTNPVNIVHNWRGYEINCAKKIFSQGNLQEKLLGYGYGKGIDVGEYAYLVMDGSSTTIPILHNGYYTMLIKSGIIGIVLYLLFYLDHIKTAFWRIRSKYNSFEAKLYLGVVLALMIITYFVDGIISKKSILEMCLLLGYLSNVDS